MAGPNQNAGRRGALVIGVITVAAVLAIVMIRFAVHHGTPNAATGTPQPTNSTTAVATQSADPATTAPVGVGQSASQAASATPTTPTTPGSSPAGALTQPTGGTPTPTTPTATRRLTPSGSHTEEEWHTGANSFSDPVNASGVGPKVAPAQQVQVSCKLYDPSIASVNPGGYWYRISSAPWDDKYYVAANTFLNGDPWNGPYTHPTDLSVPNC